MFEEKIANMGLDKEPALQGLQYALSPIPCMDGKCPLGLYDSDSRTITLPPSFMEAALIHEWGHAIGDYHYGDLSESFAESFRRSMGGGALTPLAYISPQDIAAFVPLKPDIVEMTVAVTEDILRGCGCNYLEHGSNFVRIRFAPSLVPFIRQCSPLQVGLYKA